MDRPHEKCAKAEHDGARTSKCGCKVIVGHRAPPQDSPPSDHQEDEEPKALKMHEPEEKTNRVFIRYSKNTKLSTSLGTVRLQFTQAGGCASIGILVLLPRRLVSISGHPEEEAYGGDQVDQLGMDGNRAEQVLQCHQGDL
jgi:hypothetical protein